MIMLTTCDAELHCLCVYIYLHEISLTFIYIFWCNISQSAQRTVVLLRNIFVNRINTHFYTSFKDIFKAHPVSNLGSEPIFWT